MKLYFILVWLLFEGMGARAQDQKEERFVETLNAIIHGFSSLDSVAVNKFVHQENGLYLIDRVGVYNHINHFKKVTFKNLKYPLVLFSNAKSIKISKPFFQALPVWDCTRGWSKWGVYADTTQTDHFVSHFCKTDNKLEPGRYTLNTIHFFHKLETASRRIVAADKSGKELVFYLSFVEGQWYLTILDFASTDCSV